MSTNKSEFFNNLLGATYKTREQVNKQRSAQQGSYGDFGKMPMNTPKIDRHLSRLLHLSIIAIFTFVGAESMKVIFRKNFGYDGISLKCLLFSCLFFLVIGLSFMGVGIADALGGFDKKGEQAFLKSEGGVIAFISLGLIYIGLAIYCLLKGHNEYKLSQNSNRPYGYTGDSTLLGFLKKENWKQEKIQWWAEPVITILIGIVVCLFNILGGIPIIICGFSIWVYWLIDYFLLQDDVVNNVDRMHAHIHKNEEFHDVENGL